MFLAVPLGMVVTDLDGTLLDSRRTIGAEDRRTLDELTERERQILEGVAAGDSNKEIGAKLHLTEKTVKHHMTNILQKLQVRNRVEAALLARSGERPQR